MAKGDRSQSFRRSEASVWTTRLCSGLKHYADMLYRLSAFGWDWRAGCLERGPGRFGRGRLDSLRKKGLAAYLMNVSGDTRALLFRKTLVDIEVMAIGLLGSKKVRVTFGVRT